MADRLPPWLKVRLPGDGRFYDVRAQLRRRKLHTVCEEARCPNLAECWGCGTATFMILGDRCTRACRFCGVTSGQPRAVEALEPRRLAAAAETLGLRHIVITSVDRDDLPDGGAGHFAAVVDALRRRLPAATVELLTPDFGGAAPALRQVAASGADVLGHNLETTRTLTPLLRDRRFDYDLSLRVLRRYRELAPAAVIKSSLMLGLGETPAELHAALEELRAAGVDWITLGQYLRPTRRHAAVSRFVQPAEFEQLAQAAREIGFALVTSGPLVRSSYRAAEAGARRLIARRRRSAGADDELAHADDLLLLEVDEEAAPLAD